MNKAMNEFAAAAFERLARKHYRAFKSGRLFMKATADMGGFVVPTPDDKPVQIRAYATRPTVDLEGDVVLPRGMNAEYFKQNRTLFVDHEYNAMSAVGKLRNMIVDTSGVIVESVLVNNPGNPLRNQIEALARAGNIGQSIGFEAVDYGPPTPDEQKAFPDARMIHRQWRLLEVSYTAFPMNGACQSDFTPATADVAPGKTVIII
jgi:hypothetical protein